MYKILKVCIKSIPCFIKCVYIDIYFYTLQFTSSDLLIVGLCWTQVCGVWVRMRPALFLCPVLISLLFLLSGLTVISGCNKALCASDVSKCLLQVKLMLLYHAGQFPMFPLLWNSYFNCTSHGKYQGIWKVMENFCSECFFCFFFNVSSVLKYFTYINCVFSEYKICKSWLFLKVSM